MATPSTPTSAAAIPAPGCRSGFGRLRTALTLLAFSTVAMPLLATTHGARLRAQNAAPVLATSTAGVTAPEQVATPIDAGLLVSDADNNTLAAATVSISGGFVNTQDALVFSANAATLGNIAGSYNSSSGVLTLTSARATATVAQWQAALQSVTYFNSSDAPTTTPRTISFVANDGTQDSNVATRTLIVQAVNDAPVITGPTAVSTAYNTTVALPGVSIVDPDAGQGSFLGTITVVNGRVTANSQATTDGQLLIYNQVTYLNSYYFTGFRFTPTARFSGVATVIIYCSDQGNTGTGGALSATRTITITVAPSPLTLTPATLPGGIVGAPYSQALSAAGGQAPYTYALTAGTLPPGLTLSPTTGVIAGTPTVDVTSSFTITATDASGSSAFSTYKAYTLAIGPATQSTWTGTVSTYWFDARNWSAGVPGATTSVLVPAGTPFSPVVTGGGATALDFTLAANARFTQQQYGVLDLKGNFVNNGNFVATEGILTLSGPGPQTVGGNSRTTFWDLEINGPAVSLANAVDVRRILSINSNLTTNGNALTIRSGPDFTGIVNFKNTSTSIIGDVTVQRYIDPSLNAGLGYRHYSSPMQSTTVSDLATPSFAPTVNPAYNTVGGLVTPFPTVFGYDEARITGASAATQEFDYGYFSPASLGDPLTPGRGYAVNLAANNLVDFVGTLNNGNVPVGPLSRGSQPNSGWHLLGNPYAASLDWSAARQNLPAGVLDAVYVYKSTSQYGGTFQFYQNGFGTLRGGVIGAMQGFFIRVSQPVPAFSFLNSWRVFYFQNFPAFNRTTTTTDPRPAVQLDLVTTQGDHDPTYVYFEQGATANFDGHYDAEKLPNTSGLNLSSVAAGQNLAVNGLPLLGSAALTVPLAVGVPMPGTYSLSAEQLLNLAGTPVYLHDVQLGTLTDLQQQPVYSFTVGNAATLITNRFELLFSPQQPLATVPATLAQQVAVYPNPAQAAVYVELPTSLGRQAVVATLLDALGRPVRTASLPAQGTAAHQLSLAGLASGVYALRFTTSAGTVTKRLTVE